MLTDKQLDRQDFVDSAIVRILEELSDSEIEYEGEDIGKVRDAISEVICNDLKIMSEQEFYPSFNEYHFAENADLVIILTNGDKIGFAKSQIEEIIRRKDELNLSPISAFNQVILEQDDVSLPMEYKLETVKAIFEQFGMKENEL